jgi:hypothetical protein
LDSKKLSEQIATLVLHDYSPEELHCALDADGQLGSEEVVINWTNS